MHPALLAFTLIFAVSAVAAENPGIIDLSRSPHARLHAVPIPAVKFGPGFWESRRQVNVERSIPALLQLLEQHGVVDNFRRLSGRKQAPRRGPLYTDSDLYKWMEAVGYVLQSGPNPRLRATLSNLVDEVVAAQEPSGYLNTWYVEDRAKLRFTEFRGGHELYCLGHLLQAGIAVERATGDRKLLDAGIRYTRYVMNTLGPAPKRPAFTGHPELEMALVELYRTTHDKAYLDFARYLLSGVDRDRLKLSDDDVRSLFSGIAFTSRTRLEGHSVRAMYACAGAADFYLETGDPAYGKTLDALWHDMVARRMYITGGVGSRYRHESFGDDYELPNLLAYTESCAAIGNLMWNWRMLAATAEARFADVLERTLYNGINSGMSIDGTLYCYRNPLETHGPEETRGSLTDKIRNPWYSTTCCPPNLERTFAALPGYVYSTSREGLWVHLYHSNTLSWHLDDGTPVGFTQTTQYPWQPKVEMTINPASAKEFTLFLRIPEWSRNTSVTVNGQPSSVAPSPGEYLALRRAWRRGDRIELTLDLRTRVVESNRRLQSNLGRVAVERGPLVYCLEGLDQPTVPSIFETVLLLAPEPDESFRPEFRSDQFSGVTVLHHTGAVYATPLAEAPLYSLIEKGGRRNLSETGLTLIPYFAFANRAETSMQVWMPYVWR